MCLANVCLMQRTTYSVSASVSCTGSEDLKSGPRPWNSGMAASCSVKFEKGEVRPIKAWTFNLMPGCLLTLVDVLP